MPTVETGMASETIATYMAVRAGIVLGSIIGIRLFRSLTQHVQMS